MLETSRARYVQAAAGIAAATLGAWLVVGASGWVPGAAREREVAVRTATSAPRFPRAEGRTPSAKPRLATRSVGGAPPAAGPASAGPGPEVAGSVPEASRALTRPAAGGSISGRVLHLDGSPAAGCLLRATPRDPLREWIDYHFARSDESGAFRIEGLDPGQSFCVIAGVCDGPDAPLGWGLVRPDAEGLVLVLRREGEARATHALSIRVLDPSGRPVAQFRHRAVGGLDDGAKVERGPGFLRWEEVWGPVWLEIWDARDGYGRALPLGAIVTEAIEPAGGEHEVRLPEEQIISGHTVDALGLGVPGVVVAAYPRWVDPDHRPEQRAYALARSGADGSFRLGGLPEGVVRVFFTPAKGHAHVDPLEVASGTHDLAVPVPQAVTAIVRVLHDDGTPVEGIFVVVDDSHHPHARLRPFMGGGVPHAVSRGRTGADGRVTLDGLDPSRRYDLWVNKSRRSRRDVFARGVAEWRPADTTVAVERSFEVSGRVLDGWGHPVAGARVRAEHLDGSYWRGAADEAGCFWLGPLAAGPCRVEAWPPGADLESPPLASVVAPAGSAGLTLCFPPAR